MKQHERILTGDKLLICHVCEKRFTTRQAVLHTVVVHTGEGQVKINIEDAYASAASPKVTMSPVKEEELPSLCAIRLDKDLSKFADFVSMPSLMGWVSAITISTRRSSGTSTTVRASATCWSRSRLTSHSTKGDSTVREARGS